MGTKLTEEASKALASEGGVLAKALWEKLHPQVESKGAAQEAAQDMASTPNDEEARITFKRQLSKLFDADPDLARAVAQVLQQSGQLPSTSYNVRADHGGIAIGRDAKGGTYNARGDTYGSPPDAGQSPQAAD